MSFSSSSPSVEYLLTEIASLLALAEARLRSDPLDDISKAQIVALEQLRTIMHTSSLPPSQLISIGEQIRAVSRQQPDELRGEGFQSTDASNLVASLRSAGLAPSEPALIPIMKEQDSATSTTWQMNSLNQTVGQSLQLQTLTFDSSVLQRYWYLWTNADSNFRPRPGLLAGLYENMPKQCGICGRRFRNDATGIKASQNHLDWHFQINKRLRESAAKSAPSRSWYLDEEVCFYITILTQYMDNIVVKAEFGAISPPVLRTRSTRDCN